MENDIENLKSSKENIEDEKKWEIVILDGKIKDKNEELNNLSLLFDQQNADYIKVNGEMEDMKKELEKKDELLNESWKLERDIDEKNKKLVEIRDEIIAEEDKLVEIRDEIKELDKQRIEIGNEVADYVKKKMELKEKQDKLDVKEKYLRKRYEEAGIKFD